MVQPRRSREFDRRKFDCVKLERTHDKTAEWSWVTHEVCYLLRTLLVRKTGRENTLIINKKHINPVDLLASMERDEAMHRGQKARVWEMMKNEERKMDF